MQEGLTYKYNASGLVTEVNKLQNNNLIVKFYYDDKGQRIRKEVHNYSSQPDGGSTDITWYVRDASGNPMGIYTKKEIPLIVSQIQLKENPVYGAS